MAFVDRPTATITAILTIIFTLTASTAANSVSGDLNLKTSSFYDVLQSYGLPMGVFPKDISEFSIDPVSGLFELLMLHASPCDAKFETPVRYESIITGRLSYGMLSDLSGVAAQDLFLWLAVKSIHVDIPSSGLIYFDVGVVSKQFSLSFFDTPKECIALQDGAGNDDMVVFFDNGGANRAVENLHGNFEVEQQRDEGQRAVS